MSDLILKAHPSMSFADKDTRTRFVALVSQIINTEPTSFTPEQLNKGSTDLEWCVDAGNDWWVFFDRDDKSLVRIKNRYDVKPLLMSLGGWIAYRWRMEVMTPELALPGDTN